MIQGKCPLCGKRFETESLRNWPSFPFCSERCKLVDLGRWIEGDYAIPEATPEEPVTEDSDDEE
jgi:endogenous inhibitor of DNA gyrase (YacG/DUF329 family)